MPAALELKITINEAGQLGINGPLDNPPLAYYILRQAEKALDKHYGEAADRLIQPVSMGMPRIQ